MASRQCPGVKKEGKMRIRAFPVSFLAVIVSIYVHLNH